MTADPTLDIQSLESYMQDLNSTFLSCLCDDHESKLDRSETVIKITKRSVEIAKSEHESFEAQKEEMRDESAKFSDLFQ